MKVPKVLLVLFYVLLGYWSFKRLGFPWPNVMTYVELALAYSCVFGMTRIIFPREQGK